VVDERIVKNPCKAKTLKPPKPDQRKIIPWEAGRIAAIRAELPRRYQAMADAGSGAGSGAGLRQGEVFGLSPSSSSSRGQRGPGRVTVWVSVLAEVA
jgi:hypothetical protein